MGTLNHENTWSWEIVSEGFGGVLRGKLYEDLAYESSAQVDLAESNTPGAGAFRITAYDGMLHEGQWIVAGSVVYIQRVTYWESDRGFLTRWEITGAQC